MDGRKRYVLHPGSVSSENDGQVHYISAVHLARLYGVDLQECYIMNPDQNEIPGIRDDLIHLGPRYSGDYRLPEKP